MSKFVYIAMTIATGMLIPIQAGLNAALRKAIDNPYFSGSLNALLAAFILIMALLVMRMPVPTVVALSNVPWWTYLGGACGAVYILVTLVSAPKLGAILLIVCLAAGQMLASVCIDHFGWVGYQVRPVTVTKIVGLGCIIMGVYLIQR